ncbi:hypothetical protein HYS00_03890 [Candidatus Microgenomates bacterium]|nr:hypothetical protein [Candidatus Microgenomates bacterium]
MSLALESLRGQRLDSRCKIHTLLREGESWPVHHGDMGDFDFDFEGVLGGQSLAGVVQTLRDRKDTIHGLDLMGYGQILVHANVDAGAALALTDARSKKDKDVQDFAGIDLIEGDILRKAPWKQLETWILDQNKSGFDLIISHPVGALNILPDNPFVHHRLLQRMWHHSS